jgi:hypothetical protein
MKALLALAVLGAAACSGTTTAPSTTPPVIVPPTSATVTGRVTAVNGGQPLSGISVALGANTVTTDGTGAFSSTLPFGSMRVTLSAVGILPRSVTAAVNASRDLPLDAIALGSGFDATFYRQFVRNTFDVPAGMEPLRRWTQHPNLYIRTVDETGAPMDAKNLDRVESVIRDTASGWTDGKVSIASVTRGSETRVGTAGWITVRWPVDAKGLCGTADVARSGGAIDFYYKAAPCLCENAVRPRTIRHELGHAFGYWHTDRPEDLMFGNPTNGVCDGLPSARERYHAAIAYSRPVGNTDPDNDPTSAVLALPHVTIH